MYSTSNFQKNPDFYKSFEECSKKEQIVITNQKYNYKHRYFSAGDEEQFKLYRDMKNYNLCEKSIDLK